MFNHLLSITDLLHPCFRHNLDAQPYISRIFNFSRKFGSSGYQPKIAIMQLKFSEKVGRGV